MSRPRNKHDGKFAKGQPPPVRPGRLKGSKNRFTKSIKEAMRAAAERIGLDGKGKDELVGFYERVGRKDMTVLATLLARAMPLEVDAALAVGVVRTVNILPIARGDLVGPDGRVYSREAYKELFPDKQPEPVTIEHAPQMLLAEHEPLQPPQPVEPLRSGPPKLVVDNDLSSLTYDELLQRAKKAGLI
jgi:hypothetical protein